MGWSYLKQLRQESAFLPCRAGPCTSCLAFASGTDSSIQSLPSDAKRCFLRSRSRHRQGLHVVPRYPGLTSKSCQPPHAKTLLHQLSTFYVLEPWEHVAQHSPTGFTAAGAFQCRLGVGDRLEGGEPLDTASAFHRMDSSRQPAAPSEDLEMNRLTPAVMPLCKQL